jgi:hypothetical protein
MAFGATMVVPGPSRAPLPYGLFSVLDLRTGGDAHWQNGVEWESLTCAPASGVGEPECEPGDEGQTQAEGLPKGFVEGSLRGDASAFTIYGTYKCSPTGHDVAFGQDRATQHLLSREEARVEQALWSGDLGNTPNFVGTADDLGTGLLEGYVAEHYGSQGVIHVPRRGAVTLAQLGAIITNGSGARTVLGTPVVIGSGYPDAASGTANAVVTPALIGYRSEVFTSSSRRGDLLDRGTNDLYAIAERNYLIGFDDCGVGIVNFNLGGV